MINRNVRNCSRSTSLSDRSTSPIGGYFELELPDKWRLPYLEAQGFQSARAAFFALIRAGRPKRIWMPRYSCDAMLAPLQQESIECIWYDVNDQLVVDKNLKIETNDWLLYVNYFGICNKQAEEVIRRFSPDQVVLDYSQAFFAPPQEEVLATVYSPRKFFGVPDGGLIISKIPIGAPKKQDADSFKRMSHLIRRLGDSPEAGYDDFKRAEESLTEIEPKRMSRLTKRILSSIDYDKARKKRSENFSFLHERLGGKNKLAVDVSRVTAPLCYPFLSSVPGLRERLIDSGIFVATYWPDSIGRVNEEWAEKMVRKLLPLPIDQRYGAKEMQRIAAVILGDDA